MLTYTIGLISLLSEKVGNNILKMARTGIREWENIRKQKTYNNQLSLF